MGGPQLPEGMVEDLQRLVGVETDWDVVVVVTSLGEGGHQKDDVVEACSLLQVVVAGRLQDLLQMAASEAVQVDDSASEAVAGD